MNYECITIKRQNNNSKYGKKTKAWYIPQILPVYMYSRHNNILQTWLTAHAFPQSPEAQQENMAKLTHTGTGGGRKGVEFLSASMIFHISEHWAKWINSFNTANPLLITSQICFEIISNVLPQCTLSPRGLQTKQSLPSSTPIISTYCWLLAFFGGSCWGMKTATSNWKYDVLLRLTVI